MTERRDLILILDFGGQYTQLIARRVREQNVYSEIHPFNVPLAKIRELAPRGIILSGGPASCYAADAPRISNEVYELGVPDPGDLLRHAADGAAVRRQGRRRRAARVRAGDGEGHRSRRAVPRVRRRRGDPGLDEPRRPGRVAPGRLRGDRRERQLPGGRGGGAGAQVLGRAVSPRGGPHPAGDGRSWRTSCSGSASAEPSWTMAGFAGEAVAAVAAKVGTSGRAVCGLSGGVDSSVAAALVLKAMDTRLTCIFVDTGLQRAGEAAQVESLFRDAFKANLRVVDASERFLSKLAGVTDPEQKRKIIGGEFIAVFEEEAKKMSATPSSWCRGRSTPTSSSRSRSRGRRRRIKSHHNVGGLPERMHLKLIEPLRELFKDEVRALGAELGLPRACSLAASVSGARPRRAHPRRGHARALRRAARGRRDHRAKKSAPPGSTSRSGSPSACCCRCGPSA